jgi:hypothetical protein
MTDMQKLFIGFLIMAMGTFALVMIMGWGSAGGIPPVETGIALATMIIAFMLHRLTEAVRERKW